MIFDDDAFNQKILADFLNSLEFQVIGIANNGLKAYKKYLRQCNNDHQPDIITMDIVMPIMNGKESADKIRESENLKGLVLCFIIIVSGITQNQKQMIAWIRKEK